MPTILIVRPEAQAAADIAVCEAAGWRALPFSPISLEPDMSALLGLNKQFQAAQAVFWVSPGAIGTAAPYIDFSDGGITQITVGQASRNALEKFCSHSVISPESGNDSEAVLALPEWNSLPSGAGVLIIRGHGGRGFLADVLRRRGFAVSVAEVYFRRPKLLDWTVFEAEKPQAAYITSAEMVRGLFAQAPDRITQVLRTLLYFTHHPRIADALRNAGAHRIELVERLNPHSLGAVAL
ncbi:uroporphyrinogen-III synthase [Neisseria musculi]|uniref:Uroporphyrinogen-III synthase HemD family protein n=1 Tax=Neisseria musculi TaxID=1815583 RepID=A0A7H1M9G5_9NEIS|nr:uroporphyrinogen-III synthase [Neisseria musculi]QNT58280.1 uroporphyrinogen-III synthase HemD family protein [Neisseria musculi]